MLLAVGRLAPSKDHANLLRAVARLSRDDTWQLAIAGDGPSRAETEAHARDMGLVNRVRFLGMRSDVPALLSAADVFVLSSAWEGFPMVVGEAMACERVVVATDCGGVAEFLGKSEFLVPPRDPVALADALRRAMALPAAERTLLGRAARARVAEHFSHDRAVQRWLDLYAEEPHQMHAPAGNVP